MAERRCFTKKITESDAFLDMPVSTQCLYFHLNMNADDDGFVNNPRKLQRMVGCTDDDLKLLIAKNFLLVFDTGVIVIKHWRMHNTLRNDRYHPTDYKEEYERLGIKENGSYTFKKEAGNQLATDLQPTCNQLATNLQPSGNQLATNWQPNGNHLETEHNITKHNITKHKYGEYQHVLLSDDELDKLKAKFKDWEARIKRLDEGIEMKGYKYKNHYLTILKWAEKDAPQRLDGSAEMESADVDMNALRNKMLGGS